MSETFIWLLECYSTFSANSVDFILQVLSIPSMQQNLLIYVKFWWVEYLSCGCFAVVPVLVNQLVIRGLDNTFVHVQLVNGTWLGAYSALCVSCGYFAYDQWDMLRYRLYTGWIPSILLHHLILLVCFTLALYRKVAINYLILTLVCEVYT